MYKINKSWNSQAEEFDVRILETNNTEMSPTNNVTMGPSRKNRDIEKANEVRKLIFIKSCIEKKFNDRFVKIDVPESNSIGCCDYYSKKLKIGVVLYREQDCIWPNSIDETKEEFTKRTSRKRRKINTCREHGIKIIIIPYGQSDDVMRKIIEQ